MTDCHRIRCVVAGAMGALSMVLAVGCAEGHNNDYAGSFGAPQAHGASADGMSTTSFVTSAGAEAPVVAVAAMDLNGIPEGTAATESPATASNTPEGNADDGNAAGDGQAAASGTMAGEPTSDVPVAAPPGEPSAGDTPAVEEPTADPAASDPAASDPAASDPAASEPAAEAGACERARDCPDNCPADRQPCCGRDGQCGCNLFGTSLLCN